MTTAYAERLPIEQRPYMPGSHIQLVWSAPAQGQEAQKMRENVREMSATTVARGYSVEATKLSAAVRDLAESIEALQAMLQGRGELTHIRVPLKPAFTVQATYTFIGKLKPRHFALEE